MAAVSEAVFVLVAEFSLAVGVAVVAPAAAAAAAAAAMQYPSSARVSSVCSSSVQKDTTKHHIVPIRLSELACQVATLQNWEAPNARPRRGPGSQKFANLLSCFRWHRMSPGFNSVQGLVSARLPSSRPVRLMKEVWYHLGYLNCRTVHYLGLCCHARRPEVMGKQRCV